MRTIHRFVLGLSLLAASANLAMANDLEKLAGKWSVNKTNEQGESYKQVIEISKDKLTFSIISAGDQLVIYAEADVKVEKCGSLQVMKITNIKAGRSKDEMESVDDERTNVYQLGYDTLTLASNFDKERDQKPVVEVYKKASK